MATVEEKTMAESMIYVIVTYNTMAVMNQNSIVMKKKVAFMKKIKDVL